MLPLVIIVRRGDQDETAGIPRGPRRGGIAALNARGICR